MTYNIKHIYLHSSQASFPLIALIMTWSRQNEDLPSTNEGTDRTTDANADSLFDCSDHNETDITSGADMSCHLETNDDTDGDVSAMGRLAPRGGTRQSWTNLSPMRSSGFGEKYSFEMH
jgi:hypothetical protein